MLQVQTNIQWWGEARLTRMQPKGGLHLKFCEYYPAVTRPTAVTLQEEARRKGEQNWAQSAPTEEVKGHKVKASISDQ